MTPASQILIATPVDGSPNAAWVTWGYHDKVRQLERAGSVVISSGLSWADDLGRARSRAVFWALHRCRHPWEWILWWDDDVVPIDTGIVPRMIEAADAGDHDVVGAPYPRKRIPVNFPYKPLQSALTVTGSMPVVNGLAEVEAIGFGFILTRRSALEKMENHYREAEWWLDIHDRNDIHETVAIFRPDFTPVSMVQDQNGNSIRYRELLSEDYSFCARWRAMGGKVQMYVGAGAPLSHVGGHVFEGRRDELGNVL